MKTERTPIPTILHRDEAIVVVNKPAGVLSVPGRTHEPGIGDLLRGRDGIPIDEPFRSVHRLDKDASGVIIFARTLSAQRRLTEQFASRQVEKVYLALVQGHVARDGQVELALAVDRNRSRTRTATDGKPSVTLYKVIEQVAEHTLVECRPLTGRLHQIRVHMAAIDHPLAVDPIYGSGKPIFLSHYKSGYRNRASHPERPLLSRLALHAWQVTFEHPTEAKSVSFEAPLPKDFGATVNQLRKLNHMT